MMVLWPVLNHSLVETFFRSQEPAETSDGLRPKVIGASGPSNQETASLEQTSQLSGLGFMSTLPCMTGPALDAPAGEQRTSFYCCTGEWTLRGSATRCLWGGLWLWSPAGRVQSLQAVEPDGICWALRRTPAGRGTQL